MMIERCVTVRDTNKSCVSTPTTSNTALGVVAKTRTCSTACSIHLTLCSLLFKFEQLASTIKRSHIIFEKQATNNKSKSQQRWRATATTTISPRAGIEQCRFPMFYFYSSSLPSSCSRRRRRRRLRRAARKLSACFRRSASWSATPSTAWRGKRGALPTSPSTTTTTTSSRPVVTSSSTISTSATASAAAEASKTSTRPAPGTSPKAAVRLCSPPSRLAVDDSASSSPCNPTPASQKPANETATTSL